MIQTISQIDGIPIERAQIPESTDEMARIMKEAYDAGLSMVAVGGGTQLHLGNPPRSAQLAVHTGRLRGIVEYEPDNLTISVRAGMTLQELQGTLGAESQFFPLDPPCPDRATMGGLTATNASGPIRFRYGTMRDLLIGIKVVHADGTQTRAGGKLVKNVTGYDMCKLYAGSLGTLGIFSELTFRVQPKPEAVATVIVAYPSLRAALEATQAFLRADLMPDAMEALNGLAFSSLSGKSSDTPWALLVRFGEMDTVVRRQVDSIHEIVPSTTGKVMNALSTEESEKFWQRVAQARIASVTGRDLLLKCSVLYQSAAETERQMSRLGELLHARTFLYCHAGTYVLHGRYEWPDSDCNAGDLLREIAELRRHCASASGHLIVEQISPEAKQDLDVWGYQAPALELMRRLKKEFDPKGLLNPGRFVGRI